MTRNTWRNIFIGIIVLTIPCYLFGIFIWFTTGGGIVPTPTPSSIPSRTPINVTDLALTDPSLIVTEIQPTREPTSTPLGFAITPIIPTAPGSGGVTFVPPVPATATSTRFLTATPTTPPPVITTATPTSTPQILLPPTDTPVP